MRSGDETKVKLISMIDDNTAKVEILHDGSIAKLKIKGRLRTKADGTINAWVIQHNKKTGEKILGNAYFGKFSISKNIANKYLKIIDAIYDTPLEVTDEDISTIKGMVNRCIRHDQWDWYTTYKYLGYPTYHLMNIFVKESIIVRDALRKNSFDELYAFRSKYSFLLKGIQLHLRENHSICEFKEDQTITALEQELWDRMSTDSKNNLKIAEHISGTASKYVLMHYFVTIEQEFFSHYIRPFIETIGENISSTCDNKYVSTTHQILTGKTHFTLGAVYHIGKAMKSSYAINDSEAVCKYRKYLGNKFSVFISICDLISSQTICGLHITELRNGLAHGIPEIISRIDASAFLEMQGMLFNSPCFLMKEMLKNSMKY